MLLLTPTVTLFTFAATVLSLEIKLTPKERNVTRGATVMFNYLPKNQNPTNVSVIDSLTNQTIPVIDDAKGGHFNWTVPEDLELRGGYFFQLRQAINNATIIASSDSEFQILDKPKPKPTDEPKKQSGAMSRSTGTLWAVVFSSLVLLGGVTL